MMGITVEMLSIDLSNYCSKECSFCYNHSTHEGNTIWSADEVIAFANDCIANGVKAVSLGGGEPFEYAGIFEIIRVLSQKCYLTVTSNGLPLERPDVWKRMIVDKPDKIHITIHRPQEREEVMRVMRQIQKIEEIGIKSGVNLLVCADNVEYARRAYKIILKVLSPDRIILVPQRYMNTPSPQQLAEVAGGCPFQSPSCLLTCRRPCNFVSVSWDKKVNFCSFAGGKQPLPTLDYEGLMDALSKVKFESCLR